MGVVPRHILKASPSILGVEHVGRQLSRMGLTERVWPLWGSCLFILLSEAHSDLFVLKFKVILIQLEYDLILLV